MVGFGPARPTLPAASVAYGRGMTSRSPAPPVSGDPALAARLMELLGERHSVAAAAVVVHGEITTESLGAAPSATFEIGSVSKGVTGLLYIEARRRGEVTGATALGDLLPLAGSPAARVRVAALAIHRSGMPSVPATPETWRRTIAMVRDGANPYGETVPELMAQARRVRLRRPAARYSNLGYQLLGHALAAAAGADFPELVRRRIAEPLGIALEVPASSADLGPEALRGCDAEGTPQDPWTGAALGPAGGLRATIGDMAVLAAALADGSAPGIGALEPVATRGRSGRGAAWVTTATGGRSVPWHNGMTGGFASWLGVDRVAGTAAVVLSATADAVDRSGFALLPQGAGPLSLALSAERCRTAPARALAGVERTRHV